MESGWSRSVVNWTSCLCTGTHSRCVKGQKRTQIKNQGSCLSLFHFSSFPLFHPCCPQTRRWFFCHITESCSDSGIWNWQFEREEGLRHRFAYIRNDIEIRTITVWSEIKVSPRLHEGSNETIPSLRRAPHKSRPTSGVLASQLKYFSVCLKCFLFTQDCSPSAHTGKRSQSHAISSFNFTPTGAKVLFSIQGDGWW